MPTIKQYINDLKNFGEIENNEINLLNDGSDKTEEEKSELINLLVHLPPNRITAVKLQGFSLSYSKMLDIINCCYLETFWLFDCIISLEETLTGRVFDNNFNKDLNRIATLHKDAPLSDLQLKNCTGLDKDYLAHLLTAKKLKHLSLENTPCNLQAEKVIKLFEEYAKDRLSLETKVTLEQERLARAKERLEQEKLRQKKLEAERIEKEKSAAEKKEKEERKKQLRERLLNIQKQHRNTCFNLKISSATSNNKTNTAPNNETSLTSFSTPSTPTSSRSNSSSTNSTDTPESISPNPSPRNSVDKTQSAPTTPRQKDKATEEKTKPDKRSPSKSFNGSTAKTKEEKETEKEKTKWESDKKKESKTYFHKKIPSANSNAIKEILSETPTNQI